MQTSTLLTVADLERMPDDGTHREILHGELIDLPPARFSHTRCVHLFRDHLEPFVRSHRLGNIYLEAGFRVLSDERTYLQPDLALVSPEQEARTDEAGYLEGAPLLALEVVSQSERAHHVEEKVAAYLAGGSAAVVVVYPKIQRARVFLQHGGEFSIGSDEVLQLPDLLPGWEMRLAEIFAK